MLPIRSHFGTVMANDEEVKFFIFLYFRVSRDVKRPSFKWGLSPVEERFIIIQFVVVLANCLQQFGVYNSARMTDMDLTSSKMEVLDLTMECSCTKYCQNIL